ncbi:FadR/GntR family transcriptional regulator [Paraburkholderia antibiotica]|uniref:FadR family transcriptional regulator n=1 Tax=Paraburkholderia antibiotica TaxID=2728839 RepID=A0A7X9ZXC7_9BURK|nr:FadR/GntR family transcriptional regulator [Paraburkholderia antibiotica]NML31927.1 FadR family transcriptional regulator [Paraburkholderia antibiotica]
MNSPLPARRTRRRAENVFDWLSEQISTGALKPGDQLPTEFELMRTQEVSRAVAREAVQRLRMSGLIETRQGMGSYVIDAGTPAPSVGLTTASARTRRDVLAILELRICIETESAGLAAQRASRQDLAAIKAALDELEAHASAGIDAAPYDFQFHIQIARSTGNPFFVDVLSQLDPSFAPRPRLDPTSYATRVNSEHANIYEAISRGDVDGARAAMYMHLSNSRARLRSAEAGE